MKESQIVDLRHNISNQQSVTSKAQTELKTTLEGMEKLKKDFKADRSSRDTEKAALLKRAEEAEVALKPMTEELSGLKRQIKNMTVAIFGNQHLTLIILP